MPSKPLDFSYDFDVVVCVTTGDDVTTVQKAIGAESNVVEFGVVNGKFEWEISPNEMVMGSACQPNTTYFLKLSARGSHYYCYYRRNENDEWIADAESDTKPQSGVRMFGFGVDYDNLQHGWESQHWLGTIDMSKSYITVYGYNYKLAPQEEALVVFDTQGGTAKNSIRVGIGSQLGSALDGDPTKTGFTFNGWWTTATGGTRVTATTVVEGDITLYAHWNANTYLVSLHSNWHRSDWWPTIGAVVFESTGTKTIGREGDNCPKIPVKYGEDWPTLPLPTHPGYDFKNWYDGIKGDKRPEMHFPDGPTPPNPVAITYNTTLWA